MWLGGLSGESVRNWLGLRKPRGATVPFETPALRMARVCEDERDGMIAILRDFANNGTSYVVPWTSLPLMVTMTEADAALHHAVAETRATTPAAVRAVVSELALSGALGSEAKAREARHSQSEHARIGDIEAVLILHLLNSAGSNLTSLIADPDRRQASETRGAIASAAKKIGVRREDIYQRTSELAKVLLPVGFSAMGGPISPGWLRVLHDEVAAFGQTMATSAKTAPPDIAGELAAIAEAAGSTAEISGTVLGMIDYAILDIAATIRRWREELPVLRQVIDRLSLVLDEWPELMKTVHDVLRGDPGNMASGLRTVRFMLPKPPAMETHAKSATPNAADDSGRVAQVLASKLATIWAGLSER